MNIPDDPVLRIGMVGYGFMGAAHSHAWRSINQFFVPTPIIQLTAIAGRSPAPLEEARRSYGFARSVGDWRDLIADPQIDVIDICSPGDTHREVALAALAAGKHVLCEKPLANSLEDAQAMAEAASSAARRGIRSMCGFSYRRVPALAYAHQLIQAGELGTIRHVRAHYLQDWLSDKDAPMTWRLDKSLAGSGALGDIGAHIIDLAMWMTGQAIEEVSGTMTTLVPTRPVAGAKVGLGGTGDATGERAEITVDDAAFAIARLASGALATFEATRFALGRKNAMRIEINGSRSSLAFDFERMNELEFYDGSDAPGRRGFTRILTTEPEHPYADHWWPTGHGLGYEHTFTHEIADFVDAVVEGRDPSPSFAEALRVQGVLAAIEDSADHGSRWQHVPTLPTNGADS